MIVAVAGQKGGAGKTTVAVNLAAEGLVRGLRVLIVDADPQGTARTWSATGAEGGHPTPDVTVMSATMHRDLAKVAHKHDLTIIDCPPRYGDVQRSAVLAANLTIIPCGPSAADAWALATMAEVLVEAQKVRPKLAAYVLITKQRARTLLGRGARKVYTNAGFKVLDTEINDRVVYLEALGAGRGVTTYAPRDLAADEIRKLFDELVTLVSPSSTAPPSDATTR